MIKYDRDVNSYPSKILADGALSRMSILNEAGEIGRTRTYRLGTAGEYTEYSLFMGYGSKRIIGQRNFSGRFTPFNKRDFMDLEEYRRCAVPSTGCMELV